MRSWKRIVLAGAAIGGMACTGQAWSFESLAEAYRSALRSDRLFQGAAAQQRSVLEKLPQARAGLLPTLSASANRSSNAAQVIYERQFSNIDRQYRIDGWNVSLNQPLFKMVNFLAYGRAQFQVEQSFVQLDIARYDLAVRLASVFFDWQTALRSKEASGLTRKQLEAVAAQARSSYKEKMLTTPDLLDAEARLRKAEADAMDAEQALVVKAAALAKVTGEFPPAKLFSFATVPWPEVKGSVNEWIEQARASNPQVRFQTLQTAMAEKDVSAARAAHLPSVNLVASQSQSFNSGSTSIIDGAVANTQKLFSIGITVDVPIFSGGLLNSRVDEAIAMRDKAREDTENAVLQAALDAQTYYSKAQVGALQVDAAEKRVKAAESALAAARSGRMLQTRLDLDVLGAQANLLAAERDLFRARADRLIAVLQLRQASGEMTDADLEVWSRLLVAYGTQPSQGN